jgi:hypothetical protein
MKNQLRHLAMTIGLSAVLGSSLLCASGKIGVADVPFSFRIGDRVLPPGSYTVSDRSNGLMELVNSDTQEGMLFIAGSNVWGKSEPKLVFNNYGDRYFLSQVWFSDQAAGHALAKSRLEKEVAATTSKTPGALASIRIK